ncbi:ras-related C3 botulinum toxin substrate 1-like [Symsagittifera roscoffensis]|uniref:ras-related C3 botulinum toxin substrate 1-like n=1 Tax=Symsagittifera roscoffensis TaxID=84072 RepID=UPI00307C728D
MKRIKCVLVGDGTVGKTCLLLRLTEDKFAYDYLPTVFDTRNYHLTIEGETYSLELWDTAGQEDYDTLRPLSYPNTDVFILCFSVTSVSSCKNIYSKWMPELKSFYPQCPNECPVVLAALKIDKRKENPNGTIASFETSNLAQKIGTTWYHECSAKDDMGREDVKRVFEKAALAAIDANVVAIASKKKRKRRCIIL